MAAADHAASAKHATRPRRTIASEIGVRNLLSRLTKKHGDVCAPERCALADLLRACPQDTIRLGEPWIGRRAQYPLCGGVVRCERLLPVRARWPFGAPEDVGPRNRKGIRVDQASSANPAAGADQDVTQESQAQDAVAKQLRHPQGASEVPVGERKVRGRETLARLEDRDLVALLGEAESSHRAAEPRSDDQHVVLVDHLHGWHAPPTARPCQSALSPLPVVDFGWRWRPPSRQSGIGLPGTALSSPRARAPPGSKATSTFRSTTCEMSTCGRAIRTPRVTGRASPATTTSSWATR